MKAYSGDLGSHFCGRKVFVVHVIYLDAGKFEGFFKFRVDMWIGVCETALVRRMFSTSAQWRRLADSDISG